MTDQPRVVSEMCYRDLAWQCDRLRDENAKLREQVRQYQQTLANLAKDREINKENQK